MAHSIAGKRKKNSYSQLQIFGKRLVVVIVVFYSLLEKKKVHTTCIKVDKWDILGNTSIYISKTYE